MDSMQDNEKKGNESKFPFIFRYRVSPKKLPLFDFMYRKNYKSYYTQISFIV